MTTRRAVEPNDQAIDAFIAASAFKEGEHAA